MSDREEPRSAPAVSTSSGEGAMPFTLYKPGQGPYVRWCSAIGGGLAAVGAAAFIYDQMTALSDQWDLWKLIVPAASLVAAAYLIFWLVGQKKPVVDFMIATEGEMKKVNWSSRREVLGATRVVIFTVFALGFLLAAVDLGFILLFEAIKVLKLGMWENIAKMFGIGGA